MKSTKRMERRPWPRDGRVALNGPCEIHRIDREAAELLRFCPFCHQPLRDGAAGPACDRWACWITADHCDPEFRERLANFTFQGGAK